jgi:hypothetical protein
VTAKFVFMDLVGQGCGGSRTSPCSFDCASLTFIPLYQALVSLSRWYDRTSKVPHQVLYAAGKELDISCPLHPFHKRGQQSAAHLKFSYLINTAFVLQECLRVLLKACSVVRGRKFFLRDPYFLADLV